MARYYNVLATADTSTTPYVQLLCTEVGGHGFVNNRSNVVQQYTYSAAPSHAPMCDLYGKVKLTGNSGKT